MIALPSRLPLLLVGPGESTHYEKQWVVEAIQSAAQAAGHEPGWWFARDIARSLLVYLQDRYPGTTVTLAELSDRIRHTLRSIGFSDISDNLALSPPPVTLSLRALAIEADGVELSFFNLLGSRLEELQKLGVSHLELTDAKNGVKHLCASRTWSSRCRELDADIRHFLASRRSRLHGCHVAIPPA
jgi:hypothetical protein